jgi:hypothetical protein
LLCFFVGHPAQRCAPQAWLKAPLVEPAAIQQRLDIVEAMVADQGLREAVRDTLRGELAALLSYSVCAFLPFGH